MDKKNIFVGSSAESKRIVQAIKQCVKHNKEIIIKSWYFGVFKRNTGETYLNSFERYFDSNTVDSLIFILWPDDKVRSRKKEYDSARDNIIFEIGYCISKFGAQNCYLIKPKGVTIKLPSDLHGHNPIEIDFSFDLKDLKDKSIDTIADDMDSEIESVFDEIIGKS